MSLSLRPAAALLALVAMPALHAEQIGDVNTAFQWIGPDHKIVVDAYDSGPSCAIERRVSAYVLDVSPMVSKYLYGSTSFAASEKKKVLVSTAPSGSKVGGSCTCAAPSTPMTPGPNTFVGEAESE